MHQRPRRLARLRDVDAANRRRAVPPGLEPFEQARKVRLQVGVVLPRRHAVHTRRAVLARAPAGVAHPRHVDVARDRRRFNCGSSRASSPSFRCLVEMVSGPDVPAIFPSESPVSRSAASLRRSRRAGSPTSAVLSADSDFSPPVPPHFVSFAWRYHGSPRPRSGRVRLPLGRALPQGRNALVWRPSACRVSGGDGETSMTSPATHRLHAPLSTALRPRWNRRRPAGPGASVLPSAPSRRRLPRSPLFRGAITRTLRSRGRPGPRNTRFRLAGQPWPGQVFHLLGRIEGFRHVTAWLPPPPSFAWRKTGTSAHRQDSAFRHAVEVAGIHLGLVAVGV